MIDVPTRVKEALEDGNYLKNYRLIILDGNGKEDFTIDNNNLVKESVNIDERLCSEDAIKFGLCEGSHLQFEYFDFPDITGRKIQVYIDVQYREADGTLQWFSIPMGYFEVEKCSMQFSTGIRRCSCFNKLKSDYLDANAKDLINEVVAKGDGSANGTAIVSILDKLLDGYSISTIPDTNIETGIYSGSKSYNEYLFAEHNTSGVTTGNGKYLHVYVLSIYITSSEGYSKDEFYQVITAVKKISNYIKKLRENIVTKYYSTGVLESGYSTQSYPWEGFFQTQKTSANYALYGAQLVIENASGEVIFQSQEFSEYAVEQINTEYLANLEGKKMIRLHIPVLYKLNSSSNKNISSSEMDGAFNNMLNAIPEMVKVYKRNLSDIEKHRITEEQMNSMQDVTLRQLQSAVFELSAQYGKLDRETDLFSGIELNNARLLPAQTLYPRHDLYPIGLSVRAKKNTYQQLWAENGNVKKFRYLIVTYKTMDEKGVEVEEILQRTINSDGNTDYCMSDNWLFKNFLWTEGEIVTYADKMVEKMKNLTWFPFEMWCAGLPFIETGDEIEISIGGETYTTYVLQRQLKGIQNLLDSYINGSVNIF